MLSVSRPSASAPPSFPAGPIPGPLLRTILRLRHDIVMIGRASVVPLPVELQTRLAAPLAAVSTATTEYLKSIAAALRSGRGAPAIWPVQSALEAYAAAVASCRSEGLTRGLAGRRRRTLFCAGIFARTDAAEFKGSRALRLGLERVRRRRFHRTNWRQTAFSRACAACNRVLVSASASVPASRFAPRGISPASARSSHAASRRYRAAFRGRASNIAPPRWWTARRGAARGAACRNATGRAGPRITRWHFSIQALRHHSALAWLQVPSSSTMPSISLRMAR